MKPACVVVLLVLAAGPASAQIAEPRRAVRALDEAGQEALDHGWSWSAAFRGMVHELATSDVIVHVVTGDALAFGTAGSTRLVGAAGGHRYLRVVLRPNLPLDERTAMLGHELRHACEIARSRAETQAALRSLYGDIGRPVPGVHDGFETQDASAAGLRVWRDLWEADKALARGSNLSGRLTVQQQR